jgi:hypothetical protein
MAMQANNKSYEKFGIITGKKVQLKSTPNGKLIYNLKEGEVVFIDKKENQKEKNDNWYKISTLDRKTGWVQEKNIYYLDEKKIPDKYYIKVLGELDKNNIYKGGYSLYNIKFEYYKDNNTIVYRFFEVDSLTARESLELYEIKDEEVRCVTYSHQYDSKVFIDEKYAFIIGGWDIAVYNRLQLDTIGEYKRLKGIKVLNSERIIKDDTILNYNKTDNFYYLKIKIRDTKTKEIRDEAYKFDGEKLVKIE